MVLFGIWSILVAMKRIINERGGNLGDSMHEEIAAVYKGSNDEETFTAAFMFMEYYLDFYSKVVVVVAFSSKTVPRNGFFVI